MFSIVMAMQISKQNKSIVGFQNDREELHPDLTMLSQAGGIEGDF